MAVNAAVKKAKPPSRKPLDCLGISAHAAVTVGTTVELAEDFKQLHHGHAMVLLVASKIVRELNLIHESIDEVVEEVDGVSVNMICCSLLGYNDIAPIRNGFIKRCLVCHCNMKFSRTCLQEATMGRLYLQQTS